jgi:hypothetical protein
MRSTRKWRRLTTEPEVTVHFILISTTRLAVAWFALNMFRLAARSDDARAVALADWIATSQLAEHKDLLAGSRAEQLSGADHHLLRRQRAARAQAVSGTHRT